MQPWCRRLIPNRATCLAPMHVERRVQTPMMNWVWTRAKLVAKDGGLQQIARLARIRFQHENLPAHEVTVFADELGIHLLLKVGAA